MIILRFPLGDYYLVKELFLSMIAIIISSGTLAFVSLILWFWGRQKCLLDWMAGWGLFCLHFLLVIDNGHRPGFLLNSLSDCFCAFSIVFLLFGALRLLELPVSKYYWLWFLPIINSLWSFYWNLHLLPQLANIPTAVSFGSIQIVIGILLLTKNITRKYNSVTVFGWSQLLWGLHKLARPIIRYPHLAPFSYLISSLFAFITAVSMLLITAEDARRESNFSKERFSTLFKYINDFILFIKLDGQIVDANQAAIGKYGYSKDEFLKIKIFQLRRDYDNKAIKEQLVEAALKGLAFETIHYRKDGISFPVEIHVVEAAIGKNLVLMCIIHDITERKQAEAVLRRMNFTDSLTGLVNRRYLEENLKTFDNLDYLPISIIIGDLNGLKLINDAFGYKTGDDLLKEMARLLLNICSPEDLVIRWGGDEFLLFLPNTKAKAAEHLCQKIKWQCQETVFVPIQPSIALGYAVKEAASQNIWEVLKIADDRMYRNKLLKNNSSRNAIISSLQNTLFERSYETEQHAERLKTLAFEMGRKIGLAANQIDDLVLLTTLHDIGKLAIPEEILSKPGPLSPEEWTIMKKHPTIGHRIIRAIPDLAHIAEAILAHHERWDGAGYPFRLKQTEIPLISRILSILDSYDAMTNKRVYQEAISHEQAMAEIAHCAGSQFDPDLVKIFLEIFQTKQNLAG